MTKVLGLYRMELIGLKPRDSLESLALPLYMAPIDPPNSDGSGTFRVCTMGPIRPSPVPPLVYP